MARFPNVITLRVTPELERQLDDICERTCRTRADLLRLIFSQLKVSPVPDVQVGPVALAGVEAGDGEST